MACSTPGFPVLLYLLELAQTHVPWVNAAIQPTHPLSSPSPHAFNLSQHQSFSKESALCIRWSKYWSFSISPSNECSELISFRMDWFDLLTVQGTLKSLLQHHSWKPSVLQRSAWPSVKSQCPVVGFTLGLSVPMSASLLKWSWKSYIKSFIGSSLSCKINITIPPLLSIW